MEKEYFKQECIGFLPEDGDYGVGSICTHYRMGLCAFFEENGAPISCDDVEYFSSLDIDKEGIIC